MWKSKKVTGMFIVLVVCLFHFSLQAQIIDVFQNKEYAVSSSVITREENKDYVPGTFKILLEKNTEENESWKKIEAQLEAIAIAKIKGEVAFFELHSKALKYQKQFEDWKRIQEGDDTSENYPPFFKDIEIRLISVLNNIGLYRFQYKFDGGNDTESISVDKYYLSDYGKNKISEIGRLPSIRQQEILEKLTLSKFFKYYLLQTQKIAIGNMESLEDLKKDLKNQAEFAKKLDYSEVQVYPYFTGIMVEFPKFSKSSEIFNNETFRLLLKGDEMKEVLALYPEFKSSFQTSLRPPSAKIMSVLNNDKKFDLERFRSAPREMEMIGILNPPVDTGNISSLDINNYQLLIDQRKFLGSKRMFLNKEGNVYRIEHRNDKKEIVGEEKYRYDQKNRPLEIISSEYRKNIQIYHYEKDRLDIKEFIEIEERREDFSQEIVELDIWQQHFAYHDNMRFSLQFSLIGDINQEGRSNTRSVANNEFCEYNYCLLTKENGRVLGIKHLKGEPIDVLTNEKNQPVESYFENDRYRYSFSYDAQDRIKTFTMFSSQILKKRMEFIYHLDISKPLTILETDISYSDSVIKAYEYEIEYKGE